MVYLVQERPVRDKVTLLCPALPVQLDDRLSATYVRSARRDFCLEYPNVHEKYAYKFDAAALIDDFGGAPSTTRIMNETGAGVTLKAVQKMRERGVMQGDALAVLLIASVKMRAPINPYNYILEREGK